MAFPVVEDVTATTFGSSVTEHLVSMPATVNAGDLLLVIFSNDGDATVTDPGTGWELVTSDNNSTEIRGTIYYKIAIGDEDGTTVDFVTSAGEEAAAHVYRISNWHGTTPPEASSVTTALNNDPDPGALTPSWGSAETMWIAAFAMDWLDDTSIQGPTSYTNVLEDQPNNNSNSAGVGSARRENEVSSENPADFTTNWDEQWVAWTIGIRPVVAAAGTVSDYRFRQRMSA